MEEIDLKEFLKYLRKYVWIMLATAVVFLGATLFYDLNIKTDLFKSTTTVVLNDGSSSKSVQEDLTTVNLNQKLVTTYSELVKNRSVLELTIDDINTCKADKKNCEAYKIGDRTISGGEVYEKIKDLDFEGLDYDSLKSKVSVKNVDDTEILLISVEDSNENRAAVLANTIARSFKKVVADSLKQDNVNQFDEAIASTAVSNDTTMRDAGIATFAGLFLVIAVAFLIFYFDDSVKYSKNLEKELDMPVIGKIAHGDINNKKNIGNKNEIMLISMPKASTSESIRNLRANLSFSSVDKGLKSLLITSTNASEGKSFVSSNLATAYAQTGKNVLLIDGDLRKGRLHRIFKLRNTRGFSDLLIDTKSKNFDKYLKDTRVEGLTVITRGTCPPNPSELLGSSRAKAVISSLLEEYDMIIIDGAPSMGLSDSIVASRLVDGVAIVCRDGKTNRADLVAVVDDYKKIEAPFLGIVMNDIKRHSAGYGYYNYYESDSTFIDQRTMEGMNELNDAIEARREARRTPSREVARKRPNNNRRDSYAREDEYGDLPTRAELKRMAKGRPTSRYNYAKNKNS